MLTNCPGAVIHCVSPSRRMRQTAAVSGSFSSMRYNPFLYMADYFESMVDTRSVISSSTSSSTFTVSSAVKTVTLFSTAVRRIS